MFRTPKMVISDGKKSDDFVRKPRRLQKSIVRNARSLMRIISNCEQNISITRKTTHYYQLPNLF